MTLTRLGLGNPVAVIVACILAVIFGVISLFRLPVQMTPDVQRPVISIQTSWRAAAPQEVESEIIEPQEDVLRGLQGVRKMSSSAGQGGGGINLEFDIDVDMDRALIEVMNRLNQVPRYPVDATEPVIRVGGDQFGDVIAWFSIRPVEGNEREIVTYQDFVDEVIRTRIERIPGVSQTSAFGGRPYEVRITFDPFKAAGLGIDLTGISSELGTNADVSGGFNEVGRRQYTLRFSGKYDVADLGELVLEWREGRPVRLKDIAVVERRLQDRQAVINQNGGPSIAMNVVPEAGVNVLEVIEELKATVRELEREQLAPNGLRIQQVYDESVYIEASIDMVRNNLLLGILLAICVLWWFLRKFRATMMVAVSIPLCLCAAFIFLDAFGRTLNIISLAGLAFATGMVLDAAIVVLENIVRQREKGLEHNAAADKGTSQVWGALIASTATTVAIFMPVVFLKDEAGQLFGDLAVTISVAVIASLLVAVTVLPTAAANLLGRGRLEDIHAHWWQAVTDRIMALTGTPARRRGWIAGLTTIPVVLAVLLLPPADYLPTGQQNFVRGFMVTPPGLGVDTAERELLGTINQRLAPYLTGEHEPHIDNYFIGYFGGGGFFGARAANDDQVDELIDLIRREIAIGFPDTFFIVSRASIFRGRGSGQIDIDLQAESFEALLAAGQAGFGLIQQAVPGAQVRPLPGLELAEPELRLVPDDRRIAEVGWNRSRMATVVRALGDGAFVGEYFDGNRRLNVIMRAEEWATPEELAATPVATPSGQVQTIGELAHLVRTAGPSEIRRIDRRRTLTLQVTPPEGMPLEDAIDAIDTQVVPQLRSLLPEDASITYRGTAEALSEALTSLSGSFALAVVILYLLISALFRSFKDSLLVVLTIPMATVGGIVFLRIMDLAVGQAMDLLTMIGFVILLGLVVNNAILLVYRARDGERDEGLSRRDAVESAVRLRLRPILMSTMTSIFGMAPLMLMPGAGTELYRGLAAVIVGGMLVSTLFTLILLPSLLRVGEESSETSGPAATPEPAR